MTQTTTNSPSQPQSGNGMYYFKSLVGILLIFGFGYLPPIEPVTPVGMQVLGIFLGMIFLWSFVSVLWPSLLGIVALGLSDYASMRQVLLLSFGDVIPILIFFAMVLFGAIQHEGVTRYISRWFLTRRVINGKPVVFSFIFIYTTYVLAALSANILPALLFMWAILYGVLEDVGYKKGDKYTAIMVVGTMFGAISGQAAKPFTGSALMMVGAFEKVSQTQMDYLPYMVFGLIMSTLGILAYCFLIKFVLKPDMTKIETISIERFQKDSLPPMDLRKKILFASLFGYLVLILMPSLLPKTLPLIGFINKLGPWGVVILFTVGLSLFKVNGRPILDFKEIAGKYVIWDVYFLVCMAMVISGALTAETTGITGFLTNSLDPLLGGKSALAFAVIIIVFAMSVTQFANNGVMGVLFMPVIKVFSEQSGGSFVAIATLMIFALHIAILTPASSPYAAILYGNKNWVDQKEIIKYGGIIFLMAMVLYVFVGIPLIGVFY